MNNTPPAQRRQPPGLEGPRGASRPPRVCAAEIWVEALGKRPEDMTQTEARRINSILSSLPGWEKKGKLPREHPYGRQRAFYRNISD